MTGFWWILCRFSDHTLPVNNTNSFTPSLSQVPHLSTSQRGHGHSHVDLTNTHCGSLPGHSNSSSLRSSPQSDSSSNKAGGLQQQQSPPSRPKPIYFSRAAGDRNGSFNRGQACRPARWEIPPAHILHLYTGELRRLLFLPLQRCFYCKS